MSQSNLTLLVIFFVYYFRKIHDFHTYIIPLQVKVCFILFAHLVYKNDAWKEKVVELDFSTNPLLKNKQALASHAITYARYRRHSSSPTTGHWLAFTILQTLEVVSSCVVHHFVKLDISYSEPNHLLFFRRQKLCLCMWSLVLLN